MQPYVVLQAKILNKLNFHFEVLLSDANRNRRRIVFYGAQPYNYEKDNIYRESFHARVPCGYIVEGIWMNLQFDVQSFAEKCFGDFKFQ